MIRVIVADDHNLVRQGIQALLERSPEGDIEVVGEAANGLEALELTKRLHPDVLVLDIAMPDMNGPQALAELSALKLETKALVLSMYSGEALIQEVLRQGARGYLLKRSVSDELLKAIRTVNQGEIYLCPVIAEVITLIPPQRNSEKSRFSRLTPREREILRLLAEGHTNRSIAKYLFITTKTVEKHRASLVTKLNVNAVAELTQLAIKHGLLFLD